MDMRAMHDLKDMLCKEIDNIAKKGELSAGSLETVHKLTDTVKNIDKIMMLEEEEDGYSERGRKRDSMGRYSRDDGMDYSRAGDWHAQGRFGHGYEMGNSYESRGMYSREDGKDRMMHELGRLMDGASEHERRALERAMQEIRKA